MGLSSWNAKIRNRLRYVGSAWRLFGPRMGMTSLIHHLTGRGGAVYYDRLVEAAWRRFMCELPLDVQALAATPAVNDGPIWLMWWQGLDGGEPDLVKACVASIRRHTAGRSVHVITRDNIAQYATIDPSVMRKVEEGKITLTTLSDIVRFAVLSAHGGMWMDATIYLTADLPQRIAHCPFYSIPNHETAPTRNWTGNFIGGAPGNPLFTYMYQAFVTLYSLTDHTPDYYMIDVMLSAAYTHIPAVRKIIDAVPPNNLHRFFLAQHLGSAKRPLPADTYAYKLSYKNVAQYEGRDNMYRCVLNGEL